MANRLAETSSPYLLQHRDNPVDWYPWGEEALLRARREDRPIFLSIGYSACHWCHVMEHESFENPRIAAQLNAHFISIKVDREERPDLDQIYMHAVQMMTGRGGWPMSVFLTPDLKPFYGGTYWPPTPRHGMASFPQVLDAVWDAWQQRRSAINEQAEKLTSVLQQPGGGEASGEVPPPATLEQAAVKLEQAFDFTHGGFGHAPKFPHCMDLELLLRLHHRQGRDVLLQMVDRNLTAMARGGIYDHLGGGFCRYSVDERWLVPHFEKMLYDNALLTRCYALAWQVGKNAEYERVARETIDYVLRDLTDEAGGFHSSEDADSEGVEGKFYVWTPEEIEEVLGAAEAELFCAVYGVTTGGNFEGRSILHLTQDLAGVAAARTLDEAALRDQLEANRRQLRNARDNRVRPGKDDKVLTSWNALMIDALALASGVWNEPRYAAAAARAAEFLWTQMRDSEGRLLHCWRHGKASVRGFLDDYAGLLNALVSLYEATADEQWIARGLELAATMVERFGNDAGGGFYFTADDHEQLIARQQDFHDASVPSSNGLAATALLRLGRLTQRHELLTAAERILVAAQPTLDEASLAAGQLLIALDFWHGPAQELVLVGRGPAADEAARALRQAFRPAAVKAVRTGDRQADASGSGPLDALFDQRPPENEPALYICENYSCHAPVRGLSAIQQALDTPTA